LRLSYGRRQIANEQHGVLLFSSCAAVYRYSESDTDRVKTIQNYVQQLMNE